MTRSVDAACPGLCDPQVVHFHSRAVNSCGNAKGGQDFKGVGLEYWEDP